MECIVTLNKPQIQYEAEFTNFPYISISYSRICVQLRIFYDCTYIHIATAPWNECWKIMKRKRKHWLWEMRGDGLTLNCTPTELSELYFVKCSTSMYSCIHFSFRLPYICSLSNVNWMHKKHRSQIYIRKLSRMPSYV